MELLKLFTFTNPLQKHKNKESIKFSKLIKLFSIKLLVNSFPILPNIRTPLPLI
jgi:hypothetical protein